MKLALTEHGATDIRIAMNVCPRELTQTPIEGLILDKLEAYGLPANWLEIELTEDTALDAAAVSDKLGALSRAGVSIAIDDFGVGYSSLSRIRQLRVNRVKIDRSLVTGLNEAGDKRGLVQAVIDLGKALSLEVVAEGVETETDLVALREMGCPFAQGYHLGRRCRPKGDRDLRRPAAEGRLSVSAGGSRTAARGGRCAGRPARIRPEGRVAALVVEIPAAASAGLPDALLHPVADALHEADLRRLADLDGLPALGQGLQAADDVIDLDLDHGDDRVVADARIGAEQDEVVRESRDGDALEGLHAVRPRLGEAAPLAADHLRAQRPAEHVEAGGEDEGVEVVLRPVRHLDPLGQDAGDGAGLQGHVVPLRAG